MIDKAKKRQRDGALLRGTYITRSQLPGALRTSCSKIMKITFLHLPQKMGTCFAFLR